MGYGKDIAFLAEAICGAERMKDASSLFFCKVITGGVYKGDVVQILDENKECIVEQKISSIEQSISFEKVSKGDKEDDIVWFSFHRLSEYPIKNARYILKINPSANGEKSDSEIIKAIKIKPTNLRTLLMRPERIEHRLLSVNPEPIGRQPHILKDADQKLKKLQNEAVLLHMDILGETHIDYNKIMQWLNGMRWFKPDKMSSSYNKHQPTRYDENTFEAILRDSLASGKKFSVYQEEDREGHPFGVVSVDYDPARTCLRARVEMETYIKNKQDILKQFEQLFIRLHGITGFIENNFESWARSCLNSEFELMEYGFSTVGLEYSYPNSRVGGDKSVNLHCLPWHVDEWNGISFQASHGMWFGPDYYSLFPEDKLANFTNCLESIDLGNGFRCIFLYDDILDCNAPENRARQWAFRNHLDMCEKIRKLNIGPLPSVEAYSTGKDPTSEFFTEGNPFPHGGDRYAKVYINQNGKTCPKSKAVGYMYVEYLENRVIFKEKIENPDSKSSD